MSCEATRRLTHTHTHTHTHWPHFIVRSSDLRLVFYIMVKGNGHFYKATDMRSGGSGRYGLFGSC